MNSSNQSDQPGQPDCKIQPAHGKWRQRKGVALILVVSFIVLMSALVVGFFSRVTTELTGARAYAEGITARQLAESAVAVVMGQIRAATTIPNGCWASQPGMIRVYGGAGGVAGSQAYRFYKLYSSHNLVLKEGDIATFNPANTQPSGGAKTEVPIGTGGWQFQSAFFTDINEPADLTVINPVNGQIVTDPATGRVKTEKRYPIFDPSVARIPALRKNVGATSSTWPKGAIEGCEVSLTDAQTLQLNNAPMPVRWIYVLKDGTLTAPTPLNGPATGNTGIQAKWNNLGSPQATPSAGVPSKNNPIVGRIAFWTDDDTCKVNINTAGGYIVDDSVTPNYRQPAKSPVETNPAFIAGAFWDTPRVQTYFDRGVSGAPANFRGGLASSQPVRNEFQRYPGHPSTTALGLVLKGPIVDNAVRNAFTSELLYSMTPRLMNGASQGGTRQLIAYDMTLNPDDYGITPDPPAYQKRTYSFPETVFDQKTRRTVDNPSFHLYSSLDEMYYTTLNDPGHSYAEILKNKTQSNSDGTRVTANQVLSVTNPALNTLITPDLIDKTRFFLTAHSRSPELNLFGRPRVTIWPIPTEATERSLRSVTDPDTGKRGIRNPSDDLFQFCSTIGADPHPANDPNGLIRQGQFIFDREDPYSATSDFSRSRNTAIFKYLQEVTSNSKGKVPGWGQSFQGKYSGLVAGHVQILTEIFDYIRSVNLKDTSRDERIDRANGRSSATQKANPNAEALKLTSRYARRGIVTPTRVTLSGSQLSGFGRFPTPSEVSLVFYCGGYVYKRADKEGNPLPGAQEQVEYDYKKIDERNRQTGNSTDQFFKQNVLTHKLMRAFLVIETCNPMQGYGPVTNFATKDAKGATINERLVYEMPNPPAFLIRSPGMDQTQTLKFGDGTLMNNVTLSSGATWAGRNFGGTEGFFHTMQNKTVSSPNGNTTLVTTYYPFQTPCQNALDGIKVPINDTEFSFTAAGTMNINISYRDNAQTPLPAHNQLVQKLVLTWPPSTDPWPVPITEREAGRWNKQISQNPTWRTELINYYATKGVNYYSGEGFRQVSGGFDPNSIDPPSSNPQLNKAPFNADAANANWAGHANEKWSIAIPTAPGYAMAYSLPARIAWSQRHSWIPWQGAGGTLNNTAGEQVANGLNYYQRFKQVVQPGDTIRSLQPGSDTVPQAADVRTTHLQQTVDNRSFYPHPDYNKKPDPLNPNATRRAQTLRAADGQFYFDPNDGVWFPGEENTLTSGVLVQLPGGTRYLGGTAPDLAKKVTARQDGNKAADFDTGIGNFPDGPFCGKADEGNIARNWIDEFKIYHYVEPYFSTWAYDSPGDTYFSPNRQIPSPVMFGSLLAPSTELRNAGWKTLLFCPNPAAGGKSVTDFYNGSIHHQGFANPPDHLLLDLFNMPVIEPYAISEPFSTDGKVNLNYQLMPFGYIERSTALRAALHPLRVTAIPTAFTRQNGAARELAYKGINNDENLRYLVDRDETLKGFKHFYDQFGPGRTATGFFKSASQVCEMFLYPKGQPVSGKNSVRGAVTFTPGDGNIKAWWNSCTITGDNVREKPYSDLYSRITTKSNTYTVHYRVQSLRQQPFTGTPNSPLESTYYQTWDETRDKVMSEYRGHTTIERYLDPRDSRFTYSANPAAGQFNPETQSLEPAYRFRVIYNKRFSPW